MYTEVNQEAITLLQEEIRSRTNAFIASYSKRGLPLEELVAIIESDRVMVDAYEENGTVLLARTEDVQLVKAVAYFRLYATSYEGTITYPTRLLNILLKHVATDTEAILYCKATGRDEYKLWKHHKGGYYLLDKVTNVTANDPEKFPVTVVYQNLVTEEWWSRSRKDWGRLFTKIR